MPVLRRPLPAFMLGACLFALSACDSKDDPSPDAGATIDAGTDAGTEPDAGSDAGSTEQPPVIPEGHTLLTPSFTEVHSVPWGDWGVPLRFAFLTQAGHHYDFIIEAENDGHYLSLAEGTFTTLAYEGLLPPTSSVITRHWSGLKGNVFHTVEVSRVAEGARRPFTFRFVDMGPDDHGDLPTTATPWTPSEQVLVGKGEHWGERDLLSFKTVAGKVYALDCTFPTPYWDLSIINDSGQRYGVANNDTTLQNHAATAFKSPGGVFFASIKDQQDNTTTQPYSCVLKDMGAEDHGDTVETATRLGAGTSSVQAKIETVTDTDVFSLSVLAGHHYRGACTIDGDKACEVRNARPGGEFTGPPGDRTRTAFKTSQTSHFVSVNISPAVPAYWVQGHYTLQIEDLGADDHGDTLATATPLTGPTQTVSVRIPDPVDHDVLSFQGTAGQRYQFSCDWKETPGQVQLYADVSLGLGTWVQSTREHVGQRWVQSINAPTSGTYNIDLWTDSTATLGDSSCQFEVLAPE
ncbi:hypothetical protein [Corallococcus exiguus]|uniref:hypothetical protein n=1 Tax=Corallococcus exiguus TaxID=83462 RepID=UPI0015605638|nr:hypothetical protein [Corallococcus exiguus]NRD53041.1 hypothetical protein [Corallococcus exiguus]